ASYRVCERSRSAPPLTARRARSGVGAGVEVTEADASKPGVRRGALARAPPPPGTTARRDPRRAELFRRLDASCDARRREPPSPPHFAPSLPPPPPGAPEDDQPIWPPRSRYWERYKSLRNMESNPEHSMMSPTEDSVPPPSGKRQKILSDKDGDQCDDTSQQIVIYKNDKSDGGQDEQSGSHLALKRFKPSKTSKHASVKNIGAFAVQCAKCQKWRLISTKEKYEEIRERIREDPFVCEKAREWKPGVTCNDPSDVSQDGSKLWALDKPDIAQAPRGWERLIKIRGEGSTKFSDVYYRSPTGVQLRSTKEVEKYLAEHPEYVAEGVELSHFSFKSPAPLQKDYVRKRSQTSQSGAAHTGSSKPLQPEEVQPISWAPPPENNKQLVLYNQDQREVVQSEPLELTEPEGPPPAPDV
ncbi:unnamed protein product, partial [Urochloa humidicola]